jgi:P-type Cu2+ transporter
LSSALAARIGILVKDRLALEESRTVDAFLFDKTGTLTKGEHTVMGVAGVGVTEEDVLRLGGGVESDSEHPLARAIVAYARNRGPVAIATDIRSIRGRGVEAVVDSDRYAVGGPALLRERSLDEPTELTAWSQGWKDRGTTVFHPPQGDTTVRGIALEDEIRPEARAAVAELRSMGRRVVMITGDARQVADAVGADLGVDEVFAEVLPEDKDAKVAELQARGLKVAWSATASTMRPPSPRADVGIAIGAGTDVAIESAGLILASSDPRSVVAIIRLSKAAYRKSLQNLWWAAGYNAAAIPIAAGVLAWAGVSMPPAVAAVLMSVSTIVVAANAQLLRRVDLRPAPIDQPTTRPHPVAG